MIRREHAPELIGLAAITTGTVLGVLGRNEETFHQIVNTVSALGVEDEAWRPWLSGLAGGTAAFIGASVIGFTWQYFSQRESAPTGQQTLDQTPEPAHNS